MLQAVRFVQAAAKGSSHPSLVEADDANLYWVKFQGNPQGGRTLVNDWIASRLALSIGLPVCLPQRIYVSRDFVDRNPGTWYTRKSCYGVQKPFPGVQFAIPHVEGTEACAPDEEEATAPLFAGGFAFDVWTAQEDRRQAIFRKEAGAHQVAFIDFGRAFAPDHLELPLEFTDGGRAPYCRSFHYSRFTRMADFEPWLTRIEGVSSEEITAATEGIPRAWFAAKSVWDKHAFERGDSESFCPDLSGLVAWLVDRARWIRPQLEAEIAASPDYFQAWSAPFSPQALEERERRQELACSEDAF